MAEPTKVMDRKQRGKKMLIYGDPGIGKTRLVGQFPKCLILRPPFDNTDSIREGTAQEMVMRDWDSAWEAFEFVRHEGFKRFDWIWLDSISIFQEVGLDDIWQTVKAEKPHRARYGLDKAEYGINMLRLSEWVRHMVGMADSGMFNFGITAHPAELPVHEPDPDSDEKLMPYIQGKNMATKICGYMNVVAYYGRTSKGTRCLYFEQDKHHYAKDQFDAFEGGRLLNPTAKKVIDRIKAAQPAAARSTRKAAPKRRRVIKK